MVCWLTGLDVGRAPWDVPENGFSGLSLAVNGGECVALAGPAGAVSAALRILAGDERPSCGAVRVLHAGVEVEVTGARPERLLEIRRITIGTVESGRRLPPDLTGIETVAGPALRAGRAWDPAADTARRVLGALGVPGTLFHRTIGHWPAAERRKLPAALAFAIDYPVILADNPLRGLDGAGRRGVERLLAQAVARGSAVVVAGDGAHLAGRAVTVAVAAVPSSPAKRCAKRRDANFAPEARGGICYLNPS
ncbi:alpha-D-ribose 1-methylphosphonate 5-triphosphate synthase subunit PhnL [Azospirillum fermentarium]|uniref:ABC transporter ATP-binding protein n=1 Tax=Azospirillum fermentarium TaxID=1233114 RepID=UPI0022271599|nr:ATP-binding cassette domain-containing protein [Azospirillum fermentarium]MCW2247185.1 alpha-D-ribose 1-methylphosphonate 5-triphosphate synthase subunit PhnL [Azospirillum fermentarium]